MNYLPPFFKLFVAAQDQNIKAIRAICCTTHTRSARSDTSAARRADALSGCSDRRPTHTGRRWTGLPLLISSPSSLPPPGSPLPALQAFVLLWNEVRWSIALKISQKGLKWISVAPVCLLNFLTFLSRRKTNGCPLWNSLKQCDC